MMKINDTCEAVAVNARKRLITPFPIKKFCQILVDLPEEKKVLTYLDTWTTKIFIKVKLIFRTQRLKHFCNAK